VDTATLAGRLEETIRAGRAPGLHGLVVVHNGQLVLEHYGSGMDFSWGRPLGKVDFGPDTPHDIRSVTKSVVALLYGIALAAGNVPAPSEPLLRHLSGYADTGRTELTIGHVLTMTLGLEWNEDVPYTSPANSEIAMELAPDRYRYLLERPRVAPPGTRWHYCGGASALLGRLIADGTGAPLPDFARDALFVPLDIAGAQWLAGADGVASAASGLRLAPRDLARIGQCVLGRGEWRGRQVIPAGWLDEALRPHVEIAPGFDYGYQWYGGGDGQVRWWAGMGNGGQRLFVVPERDLVVAITAGNYDTGEQSTMPVTILNDVILAEPMG
jgi:CubicO group peptidase (beta-lactamase class C family)